MKTQILVIDDDPLHCKMLSFVLTDAGYEASILGDRRAVNYYLQQNAVDLILLDLSLPFGGGLGLCAQLRRDHSDIPVILLSERVGTADLVKGFNQGADDYVTRPYEPAELLARVQAVLRRYRHVERHLFGALVKVGETSLDLGRLSFTAASGRSVVITPTEMRILECLMRSANAVISREKLIVETWGYDSDSADNRVDVYIRRLRRKIEAHPKDRNLIRTVRGIGYVFQGEPSNQRHTA
jgi:two-component system, OmpR family, response regulator RegX3